MSIVNPAHAALLREWTLIQHRMAVAKKRLAELEAPDEKPPFWNRVYPIDIELPLAVTGGPAVFGTTTVDPDTTFYARGIEAFYTASGVLAEDGSPATLTLPPTLYPQMFDFTWSIRDSSTDRDWNNVPLPAMLLRSGNVSGMWWRNLQARLRGSTVVTVTINPLFFGSFSPDPFAVASVTNHSLQVILSGIAVRGDR